MGFPTLLLAVFGSLPATTKPDAALGGLSFFEVYLPAMTALCLGLLALIGLPVPTTSYRELGVLRRMATTPVPPSWLLGAQVVVNVVLLLVAVLVVVLGGAGLGAHLLLQPLGFVLSVLLAGGRHVRPRTLGGGDRTHPAGGWRDRRDPLLPHDVLRGRVAAA